MRLHHRARRKLDGLRRAGGSGRFAELEDQPAVVAEEPLQWVDGSIVQDRTVIDHEDSAAKPLDVVQVVRGEQHRRAPLMLDGLDKGADTGLDRHI